MKVSCWIFLIIFTLSFCCLFTSCSQPEGTQKPKPPAISIIKGMDLSECLKLPLEGSVIPLAIPDQLMFSGTVDWELNEGGFWDEVIVEEGDTFIADKTYRAKLRLLANDGYTFKGAAANCFNYLFGAASNSAGTGNTLTVTVRFFKTPAKNDNIIYMNDLAVAVPAPVKGMAPLQTFAINQYSGNITWQTVSGDPVTDNFMPATVYKALVTLSPVYGFTFSGLPNGTGIYHSAAQSCVFDLVNGSVIITFNGTAAAGETDIVNLFNLSSFLARPMSGKKPSIAAIDTSQYTGTVSWFYDDDSAVFGALESGKPFKGVLSLSAKPGFTFNGVPADAFFHDHMIWAGNNPGSGNSLTVTVAFKAASGELKYLTAKDGITIKGCCWTHNETPWNLIDGSSSTRWAYAWGNNTANNQVNGTDWPELVTTGELITSSQGNNGHNDVLEKPAHFFTVDLRKVRDIAGIRCRPSGTGSNPQNFFGEWEVFADSSNIGIETGDAVSVKTGKITYDGVRWYELDLLNNDMCIKARFLQFRVYTCATVNTYPLIVEAGRLEVGVYE